MVSLKLSIAGCGETPRELCPEREVTRLGRAPDNDVVLANPRVSGHHARVVIGSSVAMLEDLESSNGTRVQRGAELLVVTPLAPITLASGDVVLLGGELPEDQSRLAVELLDEPTERVVEVRALGTLAGHTRSPESNGRLLFALGGAQRAIAKARGLDGVLAAVADAALELVPRATHATVCLRRTPESTAPEDFVAMTTRQRVSGNPEATPRPIPLTRSIVRRVLRDRAAVLAADASAGTLGSASLISTGIRSTIGVPLWLTEDILGVLQVDNRARPGMLSTDDVELLGALAVNASLAVANAELIGRLQAAEARLVSENAFLRERGARPTERLDEPIGESAAMRGLLAQVDRVAKTRATVLVTGETGVGKERIAALVHARSERRAALFVVQNCAAIPEQLLESELFGHVKGAFTGATSSKRGLFEHADGGTLFLDEVGELPIALQPKLLRALQEGEIRPVGATEPRLVNVRVVAATNRDLEEEIAAGRFREDLFYRLSVFPLRVPPLRERRSDIPLLARAFLARATRELGRASAGFSQAAMEQLVGYSWPGNVRELENEVQRLVIQADGDGVIEPEHLGPRVRQLTVLARRAEAVGGTLKERVEQMERLFVTEALDKAGGNKSQAARDLGMTREGLHKKLRALGLG